MQQTNYPSYDCRSPIFSKPSRRQFVRSGSGGLLGFALSQAGLTLNATANGMRQLPTAKKILVIWADGGPSQFETFDPKPGEATSGGTRAIETAAKGVFISEKLPRVASRMKSLSVIRNLTSREGEHMRARYFLHTGFPLVEAFPRPAAGAVMSYHSASTSMPNYVIIGDGHQGLGAAYLGSENGPFSISNAREAKKLLHTLESRHRRIKLTRRLSEAFNEQHGSSQEAETRLSVLNRIEELIDTPFSKALDIEDDPAKDRYGNAAFAGQALLARRLLAAGIPFVELTHGGWDTHRQNARNTDRLCRSLDRQFAALIDDLKTSGLLEETVVMWLGEFGRTPRINATAGRDHFPTVVPVVVGGGGFPGGLTIGKTNRDGTAIEGEAYSVPDLFATLFDRIGITPGQEFATQFGSMTTATDEGELIRELV